MAKKPADERRLYTVHPSFTRSEYALLVAQADQEGKRATDILRDAWRTIKGRAAGREVMPLELKAAVNLSLKDQGREAWYNGLRVVGDRHRNLVHMMARPDHVPPVEIHPIRRERTMMGDLFTYRLGDLGASWCGACYGSGRREVSECELCVGAGVRWIEVSNG